MTNLVGVVGRMGHGKTTFAKMLAEHDFRIEPLAFADALKIETLNMLNRKIRSMNKPDKYLLTLEKTNADPELKAMIRPFWQWYGTNFVRNYLNEPFHWCDVAMEHTRNVITSGGGVIIHDVRFPNEADAIRAFGGVVVKIDRPELSAPKLTRREHLTVVGGQDVDQQHESETSVDQIEVDEVILNTTLERLQEHADRIYREHFSFSPLAGSVGEY